MATPSVAIAGATGNLGPAILDALVKAQPPMRVTVLTRERSSVPQNVLEAPNVVVKVVDYSSASSIASALTAITHCISTLPSHALGIQKSLIDGCVAGGVGHFIPSEFGANFLDPVLRTIPTFGPKAEVDEYVEQLRLSGKIEYTLIRVGAFLDWGLNGWLIDPRNKKAELWDGGDAVMSLTTLSTIAKVVIQVVRGQTVGKNIIQISDTNLSQKQLLKLCQEVVGADGWQITTLDVESRVQLATDRLYKGEAELDDYVAFIKKALTRPGNAAHWDKDDNDLLGIQTLTDAELKDIIEGIIS
ncbi:hypothetical protein BGZ61DRAFT_535162 [Ilyonectria robusta]|uniref:uncharacterized protein n=1 Tax=Ilyonectria robusta TaxID=1079257 RepID=UPI001E8E5AC6|nr:uncharacterized protein BGZ61DRAFT_535162 [Ilyonectria robusta]KAH8683745.1 hypothetical protein BGZ61DRAFT_535162 [Ilyonectria robusta]